MPLPVVITSSLLFISILAGQLFADASYAMMFLSVCSVLLCGAYLYQRPLGGSGAFVLGYTLYFAARPFYIAFTGERRSVSGYFNSVLPASTMFDAQCLAMFGLLAFVCGTYAMQTLWRKPYLRRLKSHNAATLISIRPSAIGLLMVAATGALAALFFLSRFGRGLYASDLGAYAYQLPILLHGFVVISMVLAFQRWLKTRGLEQFIAFLYLLGVFLVFTIMMRNLTLFRTFYMSGFLAGAFACLFLVRSRLTMKWLVILVITGLPLFQYLGQKRTVQTDDLLDEVGGYTPNLSLAQSYGSFFAAKGDMNMFDTFAVASQYTPAFYPYALSWLYVPLHFVPRFMWKGKPTRGITMDLSFLKGAPYSPGIQGFFLLDGGRVWMIICMLALGALLMLLDLYLYSMQRTALSGVLIAVATVYGLYLPRFLLWQYYYGMLFFMVPGILVWFLLTRKVRLRNYALQGHAADQEGAKLPPERVA